MLSPSELTWDLAEPALLACAGADLDDHHVVAAPMLLAFRGSEPLALTRLRPFGPGEALEALIELLALLLPLGADRVAVSLPGRAWRLDHPTDTFDADGTDLRPHVIVTILTDGHRRRQSRQQAALHHYHVDADGWRWGERASYPGSPQGPVTAALVRLVDERAAVGTGADASRELVAQLGRTLLLGHEIALAPGAATLLELASRSVAPP